MDRPTSPTSQLIHLAWPVLVMQQSGGCAALSGWVAATPPGTPGLPLAGISTPPAGRAARDDAHAVIDTATAGRLSAIVLASVGYRRRDIRQCSPDALNQALELSLSGPRVNAPNKDASCYSI